MNNFWGDVSDMSAKTKSVVAGSKAPQFHAPKPKGELFDFSTASPDDLARAAKKSAVFITALLL